MREGEGEREREGAGGREERGRETFGIRVLLDNNGKN